MPMGYPAPPAPNSSGRADYPLAPVPIGHQPSGPIRQLSHTPSSGAVRMPTMPPVISSPPGGMPQLHDHNPFLREQATSDNGFPIAPREWRASESPELELLRQRRAKLLLIGGTLALAIVAILALVLGGGATPPASAEDMKPEPVTRPADDQTNADHPSPSKPGTVNATGAGSSTTPDTATTRDTAPDTAATTPDTATAKPDTKTDATKPDVTKAIKPDTAKADVAKTAKPDTAKPDTAKPDTAKPDMTKATKPDTTKADVAKTGKADTTTATKTDKPTKTDAAAKTNLKTDAAKVGITNHHTTTPDTTKADAAKADAAKHHGATTTRPDKTTDKNPHAGSAAQHYDPNSALPPP
jgi:hypothetical protein